MEKITLKFPTGNDLFEFRQQATPSNVKMDFSTNSMTGLCSQEDVELAVKKYGAHVMQNETGAADRNELQ